MNQIYVCNETIETILNRTTLSEIHKQHYMRLVIRVSRNLDDLIKETKLEADIIYRQIDVEGKDVYRSYLDIHKDLLDLRVELDHIINSTIEKTQLDFCKKLREENVLKNALTKIKKSCEKIYDVHVSITYDNERIYIDIVGEHRKKCVYKIVDIIMLENLKYLGSMDLTEKRIVIHCKNANGNSIDPMIILNRINDGLILEMGGE